MKYLVSLFLLASACASSSAPSAGKHLKINVQCGGDRTLNEYVRVDTMTVEIDLTKVQIVDNKLRCYVEVYESK